MAHHHILMGDIIDSSQHSNPPKLRNDFMGVVAYCNNALKQEIVSPLTVTLGDEFHGVAASLESALRAVFCMEETILRKKLTFKIRYVAVYGVIDTPINPLKAHTMMGPGLTKAREILTDKARGKPRFRFDLPDIYCMHQLNRLFLVCDGLTNRWAPRDGRLIYDMLTNSHNKEVGALHGKNRSQIWKRRKNLLIEEYQALKEAIIELGR